MYYIITKKHMVWFLLFVFLILSAFTTIIFSSTKTSWGVKFREKNECPAGNASSEYLLKYDSYFVGDILKKNIYLTFDVGYEAGFTESILDTLKKHDVKACFFIVGNYFVSDAETIKRMDEEGHIVANHTNSHPNMSKMSTIEDFKKQIEPVEEKYTKITGKEMKKYYRPPQGIFNTTNLEHAKSLGYKTIFWSLAYVDWNAAKQIEPEKAISNLMSRIHNGAIILLHNNSKTNMDMLDEFITKVKKEGYVFDTLDNLGDVFEN